ncbi:putative bifunctional diguanylate cyclase/phosphodiesterase [Marinomonas aquiplantarum]|uniref:Diguanylate cyclase/phosphodiesterase n=1 Tax=Marinomonas aquiplantarum TaxID=491951 RepID=A0A366D994_9GAMM|nr:bifunctional diguanylate cyclase/phosphodiesterase [Marinomonas aquiplantarum]RBO86024.1 diguanylate cyclase/phosphodiesterase [Marinomonas aquiplantarum]
MFSSFQARLILFVLALLALAQLGTALAVLSSLKEDNYRQGVQSIDVSRNVFDLLLEARAEQLTKGVEILTSDFGFKQAVATKETGTIRSVLQNHGARINADVSLLVSPAGEVITMTQALNASEVVADLVFAARRSGGSSISTMIAFGDLAYQLVLVPVRSPNIVAWVGMAFLLDQSLAEEIKGVTGLDISFVYGTQDERVLFGGTTLPSAEGQRLLNEIESIEDALQEPVFSNDEKYLSLAVDLGVKNQWGMIHLPYGPWKESYNFTRNQLLGIFAGALALALLMGLALARNMTRPISHLVEFANSIGKSVQQAELTVPKMTGEFGVLSNTMKVMQHSILMREEELTYRASHDMLTGLNNLSAVEQYLQKTLPTKEGGLLLLNIRRFRNINNMLGFDLGNILLGKVANRLQEWASQANMIARLGDDKFLLIFQRNITAQDCSALKELMNDELEVALGSELRIDVSMGVLPLEHATESVNAALRRLDIVTEKAKEESDGCAFYQVGEDENHRRQLTIIRDLPAALEANQLFVVYQPKVGLAQDDCHEAEALIRWIHPELGFIPPDEFITLLENAGSIQLLTKWVLNTVLMQLSEWWQQGHNIRVAINLSAHDLVDEELPLIVSLALEANQLPVEALALEVTESAVMTDRNKVINILQALQNMGIHLAIDDFGTGQSSLAYLQDLPVNEVKIDRAFVQHIDTNKGDASIAQASINLSHSLGFQVTAEGAENQAGVALLRALHCDKIQGYFYSKPLKAVDFFAWRAEFNDKSNGSV